MNSIIFRLHVTLALALSLSTQAQDHELSDSEISRMLTVPTPDDSSPEEDGSQPESDIENLNLLRQEWLVQRFEEKGASVETLDVFEDGILSRHELPVRNVMATLPGRHPDKLIVLGAHLDQVERRGDQEGNPHGVIDDWTGVALLVKLYEKLRESSESLGPHEHTFVFVGFAYEESGLWGSESYVQQLLRDGRLGHVKAMVNFECLGVSNLFTWDNGSTEWLEVLAQRVSDQLDGVSLTRRMLTGVGADSVPFTLNQRPAITIDSLSAADFGKIHTPEDNFGNINPSMYRSAYTFAVTFLGELDATLTAEPGLSDHHETLPPGFLAPNLRRISWEPTSASIVPDGFLGPNKRSGSTTLLQDAKESRFKTAIEDANKKWLVAAKEGNSKGLAELYTLDSTILPPDSPPIVGREGIAGYYANLFEKIGQIDSSFERTSLLINEGLAYETGIYSGTPDILSYVVWKPVYVDGIMLAQFQFDAWHPKETPVIEASDELVKETGSIQISDGVVALRDNGQWFIVEIKDGQFKRTPLGKLPEAP